MARWSLLLALVHGALSLGLHTVTQPDPRVKACIAQYADQLDTVVPGLGNGMRSHTLIPKSVSHKQLVIGAGFGTTGTRSVHFALERLKKIPAVHNNAMLYAIPSLRGCHWMPQKNGGGWDDDCMLNGTLTSKVWPVSPMSEQDRQYWTARVRDFDFKEELEHWSAVLDTPMAELFLDSWLAFPSAKVILTRRPSKDWARKRMAGHSSDFWPVLEPVGYMFNRAPKADPEVISQLFDLHTTLVQCLVPKEQLLEINLWTDTPTRMRGLMKELATFVNKTCPADVAFPNPKHRMGRYNCPTSDMIRSAAKTSDFFSQWQAWALKGCDVS